MKDTSKRPLPPSLPALAEDLLGAHPASRRGSLAFLPRRPHRSPPGDGTGERD